MRDGGKLIGNRLRERLCAKHAVSQAPPRERPGEFRREIVAMFSFADQSIVEENHFH